MRHLFLLIFFCLHKASYCQHAPSYQLRFYSTENGLPSNGIKGLQWDEKSKFLWIGTEAGIARFNGIDFKVFSKANLPGSNLERVSFMAGAANGKIFAFDENKHQYDIESNKISFSTVQGNEVLQKIAATIAPKKMDNKISQKIVEISNQLKFYRLSKIVVDNANSCWVLDERKTLNYFPSIQSNREHVTYEEKFKTLFAINDANFLITYNNKIKLISNTIEKNEIPILKEDGKILALTEKFNLFWNNGIKQPILIIGNDAWVLNYLEGKIMAKNICNQVPVNLLIQFAQYDNQSRIFFIGTVSKGIIIIKENNVSSIKSSTKNESARTAYYSQLKLDSNTILTNEGHVISELKNKIAYNPFANTFSFRTSATTDSIAWVSKLASDKKRDVLFSYNNTTKKITEYVKINLSQSASVCKLNTTYYIVTTLGIGKIVADSIYYLFKYPSPLPNNNDPFDLTIYNKQALVFATCKNIFKYTIENNRLDTLFTSNDYCIRTLNKYNDYYFAGTYGGGYFIYKNGIAKQMPLDKNNFLLYTHCLLFDDNGYCWLSTNRGLFKAKLADILNAYEKNNAFVYYHYLGKNDGMDISELNGGCSPCALKLNYNTLSFPSMDGLLWANPNNNNFQLPDGNVYVDNFIVNDRIYTFTDTSNFILPQNTKTLTVQLGYTAWCNKENIYIYYRLNKSDDWVALDVNTENLIRLSNLPSGSYQLEIKKINGFGIDNTTYKILSFTIATPWYKKWWFFVLLTGILLSVFYTIYKVRTKNLIRKQQKLEKLVAKKTIELQKKNNELEKNNSINSRLISIISHDIVTPLKFLNVAGKNLLEKKSLMSEELKDEMVKEITTTSKELQLLSTNILNWIKYQNENRRLVKEQFNVGELVTQVFGVLQSMAHQKKLTLINAIDSNLVIIEYNEPLKILIYNLINNAINFSDKGNIIVSSLIKEGNITIAVSDEGVGMTTEQIKNIMANQIIISSANMDNKKGHGLGYLIIKDLIKMMDAKLSIESNKDKGIVVQIQLQAKAIN
jgi:signal transduction histidine kinase